MDNSISKGNKVEDGMRYKTLPAMKIAGQIIAFALMNTETGSEDEVLQSLEEVEEVNEAYILNGVHDND